MTFEEYHYYSDIAAKLFNYMNGRINRLNNKCELYIDMYDLINKTYANIRYPNFIAIHVGTIIDSWRDEWDRFIQKQVYIASCIAWTISHELHHADQLISMIRYNQNDTYRRLVEGDVERASYVWVIQHSSELSSLIGIDIDMEAITAPDLPNEDRNYTKATPAQFYKQVIANIIIRDFDLYNKLKVFTDDNMCEDIVLNFNKTDSVVIKSNGRYLEESINKFSQLAYMYAGYYDVYSIKATLNISCNGDKKIGIVDFTVSNNLIRPMIFAN